MDKFNISRLLSIPPIISGLLQWLLSYAAAEFNQLWGVLLLIFAILPPIGLICCLWALLTDSGAVKSRRGWLLFFTLSNITCILTVTYFLMTFNLNPVGM
ncbi:MAG: hypothetical protein EAS52_11570 [Parapedobacter sp.]|nr:MAG: hypothetical protein EAS52_11570 [Parapedobacter sp.]